MGAAVVRCEFGDAGRAWVRRRLALSRRSGKRFGELLSRYDLDAGVVWAFVPADVPRERLVSFADDFVIDRAEDCARRLAGWLESFAPHDAIACFEDASASRDDPWVQSAQTGTDEERFFLSGNNVYFYEYMRAPADRLVDFLGEAPGYPVTVGVVADPVRGAEAIACGADVPEPVLTDMAGRARAILVDAWDLLGLLVWEPT